MNGLQLRSTVTSTGEFRLELIDVDVGAPGADEVVVRIEAAPINPSDLGLLLGPADLDTLVASGSPDRPVLIAEVPEKRLGSVKGRLDQSMALGNAGAGTVVEAGVDAQHLLGKKVGMVGGAMYAQYSLEKDPGCDPGRAPGSCRPYVEHESSLIAASLYADRSGGHGLAGAEARRSTNPSGTGLRGWISNNPKHRRI